MEVNSEASYRACAFKYHRLLVLPSRIQGQVYYRTIRIGGGIASIPRQAETS